jgi:hypothetical protein
VTTQVDVTLARHDPPVRQDLLDAHRNAWAAIAKPGTWLTSTRRIAVAAEIRHARDHCAFCSELKDALSPTAARGAHGSLGVLGTAEIELVHRLVNDSGRLTEKWSQSVLAKGLSEGEYVEIVGIVSMVMMMDQCTRGLGLPDTALPAPQTGEPSRYRSPGARKKAAWLPITEPEDVSPGDGPLYPSPKAGYIYRALSSVPQALHDYWALANTHYMPGEYIYQFDKSIRAITRPQMELVASRVAALHQCAY